MKTSDNIQTQRERELKAALPVKSKHPHRQGKLEGHVFSVGTTPSRSPLTEFSCYSPVPLDGLVLAHFPVLWDCNIGKQLLSWCYWYQKEAVCLSSRNYSASQASAGLRYISAQDH